MNEKIEQIKEKVKYSLSISRIPKKTKKKFLELAKTDFEDDYGMTLKMLIDVYEGFYPTGHEVIELRLDGVEGMIHRLDQQFAELKDKEKPKVIKTIGGKEIRRKE